MGEAVPFCSQPAAKAAARGRQARCRMALCHRLFLKDFLRQGQKRSPKPPPHPQLRRPAPPPPAASLPPQLGWWRQRAREQGEMGFVGGTIFCNSFCFSPFWVIGVVCSELCLYQIPHLQSSSVAPSSVPLHRVTIPSGSFILRAVK